MSSASSSSPVNSFYSSGGVLRMNGTEFASGLDTQKLIDALTAKISSKIDTQKQLEQKTEWKRDMFREVEDLLQKFSDNYFSYSTNSPTNIMSRSFFDTQALVSSNSDIITATGSAENAGNVTVNSITQLAKAAEFSSGHQVSRETIDSDGALGTMISPTSYVTLEYNNLQYRIPLGEGIDTAGKSNADVATAIKDDLQNQINKNSDLKDHITISADGNGAISVNGGAFIMGSSKNFGITSPTSSFTVNDTTRSNLTSTATQLAGVSVTFQLDGLSKDIVFEDSESSRYSTPEGIRSYLQEKLDSAFGSGKITVGGTATHSGNPTTTTNDSLSFSVTDPNDPGHTSVLQITSSSDYGVLQKNGVLRIASGDTNRTELSKTLGDLKSELNIPLQSTSTEDVTESDGSVHHGVPSYKFTINGQQFEYNDETELNTVINGINSNSAADVTVSYSQTLNEFRMVSNATGTQEHIDVGDTSGNLMASLFGSNTIVASGDVTSGDVNYKSSNTSTYNFNLGGISKTISVTGNTSYTDIGQFVTSVQTAVDADTAFGSGKIRVGTTADGKNLTFQSVDGTTKLTVAAADGANDMLKIGTVGKSALDFTDGNFVIDSNDVALANYTNPNTSTYSFNLGGTLKNIQVKGNTTYTDIGQFATSVQTSVNTAFGNNKISVGVTSDGKGLTFQSMDDTSKLTVKSAPATGDTVTDMLGIGTDGRSTDGIAQGSDLTMNATVGGTAKDITRSTNSFTLDGLTMNVKKETTAAISFSPSGNVDDLYKKISTFVDDYNKIIDKVNTYATQAPYGLGSSNGETKKYDPLTDAQKKEMTDTEITEWNEKAKQGLLFNSPELTNLQSRIRSAMEGTVSSVGMSLNDIGISTKAYDWTSGGKLVIDDTKLKDALTHDPDKVAQLFTNTDGIAQSVKSVMNDNIGVYSNSGILFNMAGSNNMIGVDNSQLSKEMSQYDTSIKDLQTQLQDEQDRLQKKFTNMETIIYQLMNQSNYLAGMSSGS